MEIRFLEIAQIELREKAVSHKGDGLFLLRRPGVLGAVFQIIV